MTASPSFRKLSILVAAYNEEETLAVCLEAVLQAPLPAGIEREIVLVDDGSKDRTWMIAQKLATQHPEIRTFQQPQNMGKGAALRRAIQEMSGDLAIFQDADLEYDPADYPRMLRPILDGKADVVFGSRFLGGETRRVLSFWHTLGNAVLTTVSNMFTGLRLSDMETGYKLFRREALDAIAPQLKQDR